MQRAWMVLPVIGVLAATCSSALAQTRYAPPGGNTRSGSEPSGSQPTQGSPDPFSLTLAASGAAAAVGYVVRRKREQS